MTEQRRHKKARRIRENYDDEERKTGEKRTTGKREFNGAAILQYKQTHTH